MKKALDFALNRYMYLDIGINYRGLSRTHANV